MIESWLRAPIAAEEARHYNRSMADTVTASDRLSAGAYYLRQAAMFTLAGGAQRLLRRATIQSGEPSAAELRELYRRLIKLMRIDRNNVAAGYYPPSMLKPSADARGQLAQAFKLARALPDVLRRRRERAFREVSPPRDGIDYPAYYRRTFHWQTGGYFTAESAELYGPSVEFLFGGTAAMMRRQVLPPLVQRFGSQPFCVLDVATGAGDALELIHRAMPNAELFGIDLSSAYVAKARAACPDADIRHGNAEQLPWPDASMDAVVSVYLFHELPNRVRRTVLREMLRVLKPGGLIVIEDSAQRSDSTALAFALQRFSQEFHEPFHAEYLGDPLEQMLRDEGCEVLNMQPHLVAKVVVAVAKVITAGRI